MNNDSNEKPKKTDQDATDTRAAAPRDRGRSGSGRRKAQSPRQRYETVASAAPKLGLEPNALRARIRRSQRDEGGEIVADLGGGIRAFKFGSRSWRLRFPAE